MKKIISLLLVSLAVSGCQSVGTSAVNNQVSSNVTVTTSKVGQNPINLSFKIKEVTATTRIASVDAYLVTSKTNPSGSLAANVANQGYKVHSVISGGALNLQFNSYPSSGTYYVALKAFDVNGNDITELDSSITSADKKYAVSLNTVTITSNGNTRVLSYSEVEAEVSESAVRIIVDLTEFNTVPVSVRPSNGSDTPTNPITITTPIPSMSPQG